MTKKYEKIEKREQLQSVDLEGDVDATIKYLETLKKEYKEKGYYKFSLEKETEYYYDNDSSTSYYLYGVRLEYDTEFEKRIIDNKRRSKAAKKAAVTRKAANRKREMTIYKKLHDKYKGELPE